ncbi:MAG: hypothetical protein ACOH5I_04270 [Oligoflexus sp.]
MKKMMTSGLKIIISLSFLAISIDHALAMEPIWKRSFALEQDLARALDMDPLELCQELDEFSCLRYAHQYALGGHEPFQRGQFKGQVEPSLTTAIAFERVILSACGKRVQLDEGLDAGRYFSYLDLDQPVSSLQESQIHQQVEFLYRQFLGRDPQAEELFIVASLATDESLKQSSSKELARMLCFVVGSQSEFLFY